jgi:hypothetical protein
MVLAADSRSWPVKTPLELVLTTHDDGCRKTGTLGAHTWRAMCWPQDRLRPTAGAVWCAQR